MDKQVLAHFQKVDPILYRVALRVSTITVKKSDDLFFDMVDSIISQQLSLKAGATILARFTKLFGKNKITPRGVLKLKDEDIRAVGTSWSKVKFLKAIAKAVDDKAIILEDLSNVSNEEAMKQLTSLYGVGPWTAEMFLMFSLGRPDVFSFGDVGLRRAIKNLYGFKKEPTVGQMKKLSAKWAPYRTYAARLLWKSLE